MSDFPFHTLYDLSTKKQEDDVLDLVFHEFERLFYQENFLACDTALREVDLNQLEPITVTAILAATREATPRLRERALFCVKARAWLAARVEEGELEEMLEGLE